MSSQKEKNIRTPEDNHRSARTWKLSMHQNNFPTPTHSASPQLFISINSVFPEHHFVTLTSFSWIHLSCGKFGMYAIALVFRFSFFFLFFSFERCMRYGFLLPDNGGPPTAKTEFVSSTIPRADALWEALVHTIICTWNSVTCIPSKVPKITAKAMKCAYVFAGATNSIARPMKHKAAWNKYIVLTFLMRERSAAVPRRPTAMNVPRNRKSVAALPSGIPTSRPYLT